MSAGRDSGLTVVALNAIDYDGTATEVYVNGDCVLATC